MKLKNYIFIFIIFAIFFVAYKYSVNPEVLKNFFPEKVWAHRVNSLVKQKESTRSFKGIELDIMWLGNKFDVNHPPAKSIDLSLADYFNAAPNLKEFGIWLDYKNLNKNNSESSAFHLDSLLNAYKISKEDLYVETSAPVFLDPFIEKGFKTSYYLPSSLHKISGDSISKVVKLINERIGRNKNIYISAPFSDYAFMKEHFPERNKLLWHLGGLYGATNKFRFYEALLDKNVKVVLRPFKSKSGDR